MDFRQQSSPTDLAEMEAVDFRLSLPTSNNLPSLHRVQTGQPVVVSFFLLLILDLIGAKVLTSRLGDNALKPGE